MFLMTGYIKVKGLEAFKYHSCSVKSSVGTVCNTASFKIPGIAWMKNNDGKSYSKVDSNKQFSEGAPVEIWAGYNGENKLRFSGFINIISYTVPLEVECEGYSYQLRNKKGLTKSYKSGTKLKAVLEDLIKGTDIKLDESNPDVTIKGPFVFKNLNGVQVLEQIKTQLLQTIYFTNNILYCGLLQEKTGNTVKFAIGWNSIGDNLKFQTKREFSDVRITITNRKKDGTFEKEDSNEGSRRVNIRLNTDLDEKTKSDLLKREKQRILNAGYEGELIAFAEPIIKPGDYAEISDKRYPEKKATFFVDAVNFEFGTSGGRQKIKIGSLLSY